MSQLVAPALGTISAPWDNQDAWPLPTPGWIYFGRGLSLIGRQKFGEEWVGNEFGIQPAKPPAPAVRRVTQAPIPAPSIASVRREGWSTVKAEADRLAHEEAVAREEAVSKAAHQSATRCYEEATVVRPPFLERAQQVGLLVAEACAAGTLAAAYRSRRTGSMHDVPSNWWDAATWRDRLRSCKIDPQNPLTNLGTAPDPSDLFFQEVSLSGFLAGLATVDAPWTATPTIDLKQWVVLPTVHAEGAGRLKLSGKSSRKALCRALAEMWSASGRSGGSANTIEQYWIDLGLPDVGTLLRT